MLHSSLHGVVFPLSSSPSVSSFTSCPRSHVVMNIVQNDSDYYLCLFLPPSLLSSVSSALFLLGKLSSSFSCIDISGDGIQV